MLSTIRKTYNFDNKMTTKYSKSENGGRGSLIILEGLDRCGKSTQSKLLCESLKSMDIPYIHMVFPDRETNIGKTINDYLTSNNDLDDRVIHLLFSANRWEKNNLILEALKTGITVVCDRYIHSGSAFTNAKGYDIDWCLNADKGLTNPDLVIYLEIDPENTKTRSGFGNERYETLNFQTKVKNSFTLLFNDISTQCNIVSIDGSQDITTIHENILSLTLNTINDKKNQIIKSL